MPDHSHPPCKLCGGPAGYVAAQSTNQGTTVDWILICVNCADDWVPNCDWPAPFFMVLEDDCREDDLTMASFEQEGDG